MAWRFISAPRFINVYNTFIGITDLAKYVPDLFMMESNLHAYIEHVLKALNECEDNEPFFKALDDEKNKTERYSYHVVKCTDMEYDESTKNAVIEFERFWKANTTMEDLNQHWYKIIKDHLPMVNINDVNLPYSNMFLFEYYEGDEIKLGIVVEPGKPGSGIMDAYPVLGYTESEGNVEQYTGESDDTAIQEGDVRAD